MLYVHSLMGDAAPGEIDPGALTPKSRSIYRTIRRDAKRYAGPYRVRATLPDQLIAGRAAEVEVQVLGAAGRAVPDVDLELGASGAERRARDREHRRRRDRHGQAHADRPERGAQAHRPRTRARGGRPGPLRPGPARRRPQRAATGRARGNVRARRGERAGQGGAAGRDADQRPVGRARLRDHRHGQGERARRADRDRAGRALRPVPGARQDHLHRRAGVDRQLRRRPRRQLRHRAGEAQRPRLLHLPRVDRRQPDRHRRADRVRGRGGDDRDPRRARDQDAGQRAAGRARRADHRHRGRDRARQAGGDRQRRAVGPVPDARRDPLRGHPRLDGHVRRERRRQLHDRAGHAPGRGLLHVPRGDRGDRRPSAPSPPRAARRRRRPSRRPRRP